MNMSTKKKHTGITPTKAELIDLSLFNHPDLMRMRNLIDAEVRLRKNENDQQPRQKVVPAQGNKVRVIAGEKRCGETGRVSFMMGNDDCLITFDHGGVARIAIEDIEVLES